MAYKLAPETEYAFRFALVYAAGEIRSPVALGFLEEVLAKEIPPERWPGGHQRSTVAQETSIRCQAVEAIAGIAAIPDAEGLSSIVRIVRDLDYAVRVMAAQAIRDLPGRPITDEQIRQALPKGEAETILAMRRVPVTELTVEEVPVRNRGLRPPPDADATDRIQIAGRRPPPRIGE